MSVKPDIAEPERKSKRGGKRPGAGRKKGPKKPGQAAEQARQRIVDSGVRLPLEWLLDVMNDPSEPMALRKECALEALPYCHVKLVPLAISSNGQQQPGQPSEIGGIERTVIGVSGDHWEVTGTPAITIEGERPAGDQTEIEDRHADSVRSFVGGGQVQGS